MKHMKCVVVGDKVAGKIALLIAYTTNSYPGEYVPTVFDNYSANVMFDDQPINLQLWDTSNQEGYEKLRPLSYPQTDIFVVVFSLVHPTSLDNVETIWVPEIRKHCPGTPYILVGTNKKLRDEFNEHDEEYSSKGFEPISFETGEMMKKRILAAEYIECECTTLYNVKNAFNLAIKNGLYKGQINDKSILKIAIFGEKQSGKIQFALNYIDGEYSNGKIPVDIENNFFKIVEIHNVLVKLTINVNKDNLEDVNAAIFMFDVTDKKALKQLKKQFDDIKMSKMKKIPYVLVANYCENTKNKLVSDDELENLIEEFKCGLFKIHSNSFNDIDDVLFYLINKISLKIIKEKAWKKQKRGIKKKKPKHKSKK